jgi:hypothetical protein
MNDDHVISNGKSLSKFIDAAIKESLNVAIKNHRKLLEQDIGVEERQRQRETAQALGIMDEEDKQITSTQQPSSAPVQKPSATTSPNNVSKTPADKDTQNAMKKGDVSLDDIVEKLNTIRAGKSLKDSVVATALQSYLDSLDVAERTALLALLQGIAQVVSGVVAPESAQDPSESPANVKMKKTNIQGKQVVKIKPTVIKHNVSSAKPVPTGGGQPEDTTPPVPITPKKR